MPIMRYKKKTISTGAALAVAVIIIATGVYFAKHPGNPPTSEPRSGEPKAKQADALRAKSVELNETQAQSVKVEPAGERTFVIQREAVGSIDFNQDMTVQVFSPYQGKIIGLFAKLGDEVVKGQKLYTIDSPDLGQAESTLIAAAGMLELTTRTLARAKNSMRPRGFPKKKWSRRSPISKARRALSRPPAMLFGCSARPKRKSIRLWPSERSTRLWSCRAR